MECNKEEAFRAKGIAESLMVKKEFPAARRIGLKAQQLYKDLENISQMLTVCDVHCAAEKKLLGTEMDWYGILQIEETADEATIKKQYRKFALQLHPDKNQLPGAESAFKLIMDAQTVLLDKGKRSLHDIKRKASRTKPAPPYRPPQKATHDSNFTGFNPHYRQSQQPASQRDSSNGRPTFWTACPFCTIRYQYYIEIINKPLVCQSCNKSFIAYERSGQGPPTANNLNPSSFPQRKNIPNQTASKVELGRQENLSTEPSKTEFRSEKVNGKRQRKQEEESSESCNTETDSEEDLVSEEDGDFKAEVNFEYKGECPRRSGRQKQQVSYKENLSDDEDFVRDPKMAKGSGSFCATKEHNGNGMKEDVSDRKDQSSVAADAKDENVLKQEESNGIEDTKNVKGKEKVEANGFQKNSEAYIHLSSDSTSKSTSDPDSYDYPDPDFHDFDKDRSGECFSVGQVWAVYDTLDAMPRFYARIKKVFSPRFNLRITWLEACPDDQSDIEWVEEGLPAACGNFKYGKSQYTDKRLMFSHPIDLEEGSQRDTYKIFPRKGETWALFQNWDLKWKSDADAHRDYEYEFVEILSEYVEGVGARVAFLGKVNGFVSLFCRIRKEGMDTFEIRPGELFRFSHMIPSFKLTGEERGVPKGSFELDPASLPKKFLETANPEDYGEEVGNAHCNGSCLRSSDQPKPEVVCKAGTSMHQPDMKGASLLSEDDCDNVMEDCSAQDAIEIPEPEFFNFDAEKSIEKFQVGQIWSLYSDEDGLPRYYGQIMKIHSDQDFQLGLRWLTPCLLPKTMIQWQDKEMPNCCGRFKAKNGKLRYYSSTGSFSHRLTVQFAGKKNEYTILPRNGEVWAMYRNWSPEIKHSDLENCDYDVVEVLDQNDLRIKVSLLERVDGFNSVFKPKLRGRSALTWEVLCTELIRFSHQIPALRLTEEKGGSLRGFWELDPAALPIHYFA